MQKLIKVNKTELDKMILSENKDLNLIFFSVRTLKMQIEQLEIDLVDCLYCKLLDVLTFYSFQSFILFQEQ